MKNLMILASIILIIGISCNGEEVQKLNVFLKSLDEQLTKKNKLSFAKGVKIPVGQGDYVLSGDLNIVARLHSDNRDLVKDDFLISLLDSKEAHVRYAAFSCLSIRARKDQGVILHYHPLIDPKSENNIILLEKIKIIMKRK